MINVAVVDDHPAIRAGIVDAFRSDPDIQTVGEASNGPDAWALLARGGIDVLLLDLNLPDFAPEDEVPQMCTQYPHIGILVVTFDESQDRIYKLAKAGIAGYLLKQEMLECYINAVHDIAKGEPYFSKSILKAVIGGNTVVSLLTPRERQVLNRIARGDTSEHAAKVLGIAPSTVNYHIGGIYRKLGVNSRAAAATKASELGLLSPQKDDEA